MGVVLDDVRQARAGQHFAPQILGLEAVRVGRVARPVVSVTVEGQESRGFALQAIAEADLALIHREVLHAASEPEERLPRVAALLKLPNGIVDRLLREIVLELEREDGKAVDEQPDVERGLGPVPAVAQLARDRIVVQFELPPGHVIPGRRGAMEELQVVGPCLTKRRSTSTVSRLLISPCNRVRKLRRVRQSSASRSPVAASSCVDSSIVWSWKRSTQFSRPLPGDQPTQPYLGVGSATV